MRRGIKDDFLTLSSMMKVLLHDDEELVGESQVEGPEVCEETRVD